MKNVRENCIECGKCTRECRFLEKYDIDLKGFTYREDLANNCFLCGKCKEVCPKNLDGRVVAMTFRASNPKDEKMLMAMKKDYIFSNRSKKKSKELLYLGCSFPGYYPKTTKVLIEIFSNEGIDYSIDCCSKPIYESGNIEDSKVSIENLKKRLEESGTETIITACPNCYYFLKEHLDISVISVYEKLRVDNWKYENSDTVGVFVPCPDRSEKAILKNIKHFFPNIEYPISKVNCCGLGGLAKKHEIDIANVANDMLNSKDIDRLYTYCASCSGQLSKNKNTEIRHILSEIVGVDEKTSNVYIKNIIQFKYYNGRK